MRLSTTAGIGGRGVGKVRAPRVAGARSRFLSGRTVCSQKATTARARRPEEEWRVAQEAGKKPSSRWRHGWHPFVIDAHLVARTVRSARVRLGLRQADLAARCGLSRERISDLENGRVATLRLEELERIVAAVGLRMRLELSGARGDLVRLGDGAHAALAEQVVALLRANDWEVALEVPVGTGSIDVLAFHPSSGALLVVEVKAWLTDLQATLRQLARYLRGAPAAARALGWRPTGTSVFLVVGDTSTQRRVVARHAAVFAAALPMRTREIRRWLREPIGEVRGLMFLPYARPRDVIQHVAIRVRGPRVAGGVVRARRGTLHAPTE